MTPTIMIYTDLLVVFALLSVLWRMSVFAKKVSDHVVSLQGSPNRIIERSHLYNHIWIVGFGLFSVVISIFLQIAHVYYQDIIHNEEGVVILETVNNIFLALVFSSYGMAVKHITLEETEGTSTCYYKSDKQ